MFLRTKKFKKSNGREYENLYLVENYRDGSKVVQKTVMSFGSINDPKTRERINDIIKALLGNSDYHVFTPGNDLSSSGTKLYGPLLIFKRLWKELGIGNILKNSLYHYETFFDLSDCIFNMVLSRLIEPCRKRGMLEFQKDVYDLPPFELHQYYRSMDYLIDNKEKIEKMLFDKMSSLSGTRLDMAFFDTTTIIYFGDGEEKDDSKEIFDKVDLKKLRKLQGLQAKETEYQGKRLVVYYDCERAKLDKEHREEIVNELKEKTKNGTIYSVISNINYKRYLDIEGEAPKVSKKKINVDELYDGVFVITSNTTLSANQIVKSYRDLWHVEQGFRWLKSELEMGPIYHYKDRRIQAHIMICFISLILKVILNKKIKTKDKKTSYPDSMLSLKRLKVVELEVNKKPVHITTDVEPLAKSVFKAVNMRLPEKILYDEYSNPQNVVENILAQ